MAPNDHKLQLLMANLLYPAVHGTLLYTLLQIIIERSALTDPGLIQRRSLEVVFLACLVVHFAIDYLYTVINEHEADYRLPQFGFDLVIVVCLFLAGSTVSPKAGDPVASAAGVLGNPALWLAVGKLAGTLWELWLRNFDETRKSRFGVVSDFYFCVLYFWLAAVFPKQGLAPVFPVLMLDTATYFVHATFHPPTETAAPQNA